MATPWYINSYKTIPEPKRSGDSLPNGSPEGVSEAKQRATQSGIIPNPPYLSAIHYRPLFALMMEAMVLLLCQQMSVSAAASHLGENDTRLWHVLEHYVKEAHAKKDWSQVRLIMVDETSARHGHCYVTVVVDAESRDLLFMAEGRGGETLQAFAQEMAAHGAKPEQIELACMDMSPAYRKGAREAFPQARVVFDRFHVMQMVGNALDDVRKSLHRAGADLQGGLWALRGNAWTRNEQQLATRQALCRKYPKLGRAMML